MEVKESILKNLKQQWKTNVQMQYKEEPEKVKNANIEKNANEIMSNPIIKSVTKRVGITVEDIKKILTDIRDEIIAGH